MSWKTIIRLALRTKSQASKSTLSKRSVSTSDVRDMLDRYHAIAARSLFFIGVREITVLEKERGKATPTQKWSVVAQREDVQSNETDNPSLLNIRADFQLASPRSLQSSWLIITKLILPAQFPDRLCAVINRHRLKELSIGLAVRISPRTVPQDDHASHFHFFSSLPLPIPTSLPVHVHASFILADDRRNIRWDGDGTLTPDSECNHWLLSTVLPALYLHAIEILNHRFAEVPTPWPGNMDRSPDTMSKAFVDAFYSEQHLSVSPRRIFRNVRGHLVDPSVAVIRGHMPHVVKDLLHHLRPDELVELPRSVRSRVIAIPSARHASPQYVHDTIALSKGLFLAACDGSILPAREVVQGVIRYMILDDSTESITSASLHGLPLLPLADGTLGSIAAEGEQSDQVYVGLWGRNQPWPLFPPTRFLDPSADRQLFLDRGWNVSSWAESTTIVALLRKDIPESPQRKVTEVERRWIIMFWCFFDSALDKNKLLDALRLFPLIPTNDEQVFVSLATATTFPAILHPREFLSESVRLVGPLQKVGVLIIAVNLKSNSGRAQAASDQLPQSVQARLTSIVDFSFTRVLQTLHHLNKDGHIGTKFQALHDDEHTLLANWLRDFPKYVPSLCKPSRKNSSAFVNVLRDLPIWPAFRGNEPPVFKALSAGSVRLLPQHAKPAKNMAPFLLADPHLYFVEFSKSITKLQMIQPMSPVQFSRQLKFPTPFPITDMLQSYKMLVDVIIKMGGRESLNLSLQVPTGNLEMVNARSLYKSDIPEFAAAFFHKTGKMFPHPQLRSYEQKLIAFGLRDKLTFEHFKECVAAIHQDFDKEDPRAHDRCLMIYQWYTARLPLAFPSAGQWRQLDSYSFLPTHCSRRLGNAALSNEAAFTQPLPLIVSPNKILRHEYSAVAWTQRALFHETPDRKLFMADESLGIPTIEEVVSFKCHYSNWRTTSDAIVFCQR